ncbi:acetyl-CoA acetyltransferase [Sulfolobales archaeon HS-7]|nr:acetyl-CoA acetyltransferase [Sulfolobales archaeon HS-7]
MKVAIVGMGWYGFRPSTPEVSFREMVFEAASRAYAEANLDPRKDVDTFISSQEDFWEGISIADEFAPDQIGGYLRPTFTVTGDGVQGILHGIMHIKSGISKVTAVEAHSKASDILTIGDIVEFAMDPIFLRPAAPPNFHFLAALEAKAYQRRTGMTEEDMAEIVSIEKRNGFGNPRASYAANLNVSDILSHEKVAEPLRRPDIADFVDGAVVVVLASEDIARSLTDDPIWVEASTFTETNYPGYAELGEAGYLRGAYSQISKRKFDGYFVDDRYSFKLLEHLGVFKADPLALLREGQLGEGGSAPTNVFGGLLSEGVPLEAAGLTLALEAREYLRKGYSSAVVGSWRGVPTYTGMVLSMWR